MSADSQNEVGIGKTGLLSPWPVRGIWTQAFIVCILCVVIYASTFSHGFGFDTPSILIYNPAVHGLTFKNLTAVLGIAPNKLEYLPVRDLTYMVDYEIAGLAPAVYHVTNVLYYTIACVLLLVFLRRLPLFAEEKDNCLAAFVAALVFAAHPLHVENAAAVAQRKDLVSAIFFLLAGIMYMKATGDGGRRPAGGVRAYILSVAFFVLAMLGKSTSVVFPLALMCIEFLRRSSLRRSALRILPFLAVAAGFTLLAMRIAMESAIIVSSDIPLLHRAVTAVRALWYYLGMLAYPWPLSMIHEFPFSQNLLGATELISVTAILLAVAAAVYLRNRDRALPFLFFWFVLCSAPVIGLLPTSTIIAERYMLLPSMAWALLLGWGFVAARRSGLTAKGEYVLHGILIALILLYSAVSFYRTLQWRTNESLLLADLSHNPGSYRLLNGLGRYYYTNGDPNRAFFYMRKAQEVRPGSFQYEFYLAMYLAEQGRNEDAIGLLNGLESRGGGDVIDINYLHGLILERMGSGKEGLLYYQKALSGARNMGVFFKKDAMAAVRRLSGG